MNKALNRISVASFLGALFLLAFPGCDTTSSIDPVSVPKISVPSDAERLLVIDRHSFGYDLWYNSSRKEDTQCGREMAQRPIQLRAGQFIEANSRNLGMEFASHFYRDLPEELGYLQIQFHDKALSRGITQKLPIEKPEQLDAETVRKLASQGRVDLVLSIEWISLEESLVEEVAGSEAVRGGNSVTYELRSIKSSRVDASCGFRLYDGDSGELLDEGKYSHTRKNKYREPISCSTLLATESRSALAQCFKHMVRNLSRSEN